jgi:hypothetical protein
VGDLKELNGRMRRPRHSRSRREVEQRSARLKGELVKRLDSGSPFQDPENPRAEGA